MTPQQIFSTAYLGVIGQGRLCKYRLSCSYYKEHDTDLLKDSPSETRCGIGWLLTADMAKIWAQRGSPAFLAVVKRSTGPYTDPLTMRLTTPWPGVEDWMRENVDLLDRIQIAHDTAINLGEFRERMANIARSWGLTIPDETPIKDAMKRMTVEDLKAMVSDLAKEPVTA